MFRAAVLITSVCLLAGCATRQEGQIAGAALGAAVGSQIVYPNQGNLGAAVGAAVGAAIGGDLSDRHRGHWEPDYRITPPPPPPRYHWNPYQVCERYLNRYERNRCIEDIRASRHGR